MQKYVLHQTHLLLREPTINRFKAKLFVGHERFPEEQCIAFYLFITWGPRVIWASSFGAFPFRGAMLKLQNESLR